LGKITVEKMTSTDIWPGAFLAFPAAIDGWFEAAEQFPKSTYAIEGERRGEKMKTVALCCAILTPLACNGQKQEDFENVRAAIAADPLDQQEFLIQVRPDAACWLMPDNRDSSSKMALDADDRGFLHLFFGPVSEIAHAPKGQLNCINTDGSATNREIDMQTVLASQNDLRSAALQPSPNELPRPALAGDPLSPTQAQLIARGYPPRPNPKKAPRAYATWLTMVATPSVRIRAHVVSHPELPHLVTADDNQFSGVRISGGGTYGYVVGQWAVPTNIGNGINGIAALWVGLDSGTDVAQCGTDTQNTVMHFGGVTYNLSTYFAWTEWFPGDAHVVSNFPVTHGNAVHNEAWIGDASGAPDTSGAFAWFFIANGNQSTILSEPRPAGITFSGNSAEWIVERPGHPPVPLAKYGTARIDAAYAYDTFWNLHDDDTDIGQLFRMKSTSSPFNVLSEATKGPSTEQISFTWRNAQ
jgi:Peptidase A4 family